jgi:hypothetical protein
MTATVSPSTLAAHRNLPSALRSARAPSSVTFPAPAFGPQPPSVESAGTTSIWIVSALATSTELRGSPGAASVRVSVTPDGPLPKGKEGGARCRHFAHPPRMAPPHGRHHPESLEHARGKQVLRGWAMDQGFTARVGAWTVGGRRRSDVEVILPGGACCRHGGIYGAGMRHRALPAMSGRPPRPLADAAGIGAAGARWNRAVR